MGEDCKLISGSAWKCLLVSRHCPPYPHMRLPLPVPSLLSHLLWPPQNPISPVARQLALSSPPQTRLRKKLPLLPILRAAVLGGHRAKPTGCEMALRVLCQLSRHRAILWQWLTSSSLIQPMYRVLSCNFKW